MKCLLVLIVLLFVSADTARAQASAAIVKAEPVAVSGYAVRSTLVDPQPERGPALPDAPVAKKSALPCTVGSGRPCEPPAATVHSPRLAHPARHDESWPRAMSHPTMLLMSGLVVTSFVMDYKTTRYCLDRHLAREANPLMGQSPAQELSVGITITAVSIWGAGLLKQGGNDKIALLATSATTALHSLAATHNAIACGY
jgi:hypothetical protein